MTFNDMDNTGYIEVGIACNHYGLIKGKERNVEAVCVDMCAVDNNVMLSKREAKKLIEHLQKMVEEL